LEKERFFVEDAGGTWHVDVYGGQELILPRWIGKEVTGDPFFKKINMRARALNAQLVPTAEAAFCHGALSH
jgi:CYTH domain-containing protein